MLAPILPHQHAAMVPRMRMMMTKDSVIEASTTAVFALSVTGESGDKTQ